MNQVVNTNNGGGNNIFGTQATIFPSTNTAGNTNTEEHFPANGQMAERINSNDNFNNETAAFSADGGANNLFANQAHTQAQQVNPVISADGNMVEVGQFPYLFGFLGLEEVY